MDELRDALKEETIALGSEETLKKLRNGDVKKIFLAGNCPEDTKKDLKYYGKLLNVKIINLDLTSEDLGTMCKKPFRVSVLSY